MWRCLCAPGHPPCHKEVLAENVVKTSRLKSSVVREVCWLLYVLRWHVELLFFKPVKQHLAPGCVCFDLLLLLCSAEGLVGIYP